MCNGLRLHNPTNQPSMYTCVFQISKKIFGFQTVKLYSTEILRVLLRAKMSAICAWTVELLVTQLYDHSPAVATAALAVLDEACEEEVRLKGVHCVLLS